MNYANRVWVCDQFKLCSPTAAVPRSWPFRGPTVAFSSSARSGAAHHSRKQANEKLVLMALIFPGTADRVDTQTLVLADGREQENMPFLFWLCLLLSSNYMIYSKFQRWKPSPINVTFKIYIAFSRTKISLMHWNVAEQGAVKWIPENGKEERENNKAPK